MTDTADSSQEGSQLSRIEAEQADDQRADVRAILVIFIALVLGAVHFISG